MAAIDPTRGSQVSLRWLLYDGHGDLVRMMTPDYALSAFQWRGVWGEVQGSLGAGRGYCANLGHPEDETGLVYMRARYYEPATGRFISEDPARDGVNWYLYADGNPVAKVDYEGKVRTETILGWICAIAAVAGGIITAKFMDKLSGYLVAKSLDFVANYLERKGRQLISESQYHMLAAYELSVFAGLSEGPLKEALALDAAREGRLGARKLAVGTMLLTTARFLKGVADE